ncbi:MAG: regulatory protein RecX [Lachnospiraceae bacterium]|nr:regulatory protein RecX [Lachnospiraceae bacterium]
MKFEFDSEEEMIKGAKKRALKILERKDRTKKELIDKLTEDGFPSSVIDIAIKYVESYHYIDDLRYAGNYIRFHQHEKGKFALRTYLKNKGVTDEVIAAAMEETYEEDKKEVIEALLNKKHYDKETADIKTKQKITGFLLRRGFSMDEIRKYL